MKTYTENMTGCVAQGEILFLRVDKIPEGLEEATSENGKLIVGHSETGHCHVIDIAKHKNATLLIDKTNALIAYLRVNDCPAELVHLRQHDTHESISFPPGCYQIRYRAEDTPEGWKRVAD